MATRLLRQAIAQNEAFALTPIVVQEVLQGARDLQQWRQLVDYLSSQVMLIDEGPEETAVAAAKIYFDCRRRGLTVRSTTDCLIAQIAVQHGAYLLHSDRDYKTIQQVCPLKTLP